MYANVSSLKGSFACRAKAHRFEVMSAPSREQGNGKRACNYLRPSTPAESGISEGPPGRQRKFMVDWHQAGRAVEAVDVQKQVAAVPVFVDDANVQNANMVDGRYRQLVDVAATPLVFVGRFAVQEVLLQDARVFAPLEFELKLLAPIHIKGITFVIILNVINRKYFKTNRISACVKIQSHYQGEPI